MKGGLNLSGIVKIQASHENFPSQILSLKTKLYRNKKISTIAEFTFYNSLRAFSLSTVDRKFSKLILILFTARKKSIRNETKFSGL